MKRFASLSILLLAGPLVFAQSESVRQQNYNVKKNLAMEGYDPVSYFEGTPQEGDEKYTVVHRGIKYYFASIAHVNQFKTNPEKYEPAYGGWCAYAMGESGEKVKVDPETFKIVGGKLYLFYNFWGNNTLEDWNRNENQLKAKGDNNWRKIAP